MDTMNALKRTKELVTDPAMKAISLVKETAFTRKRAGGMEFPDALRFMLGMNKTALQARLNKFYGQAKGRKAISQRLRSCVRILITRPSVSLWR